MLNFLFPLMLSLFFLAFIAHSLYLIITRTGPLGKIPIKPRLFFLGKAALFLTWVFLALQIYGIFNLRLLQPPFYLDWLSALLIFNADIFILTSFWQLKSANVMGLPTHETKLNTTGIYQISRNPMYTGFFMLSAASVLYTMNPAALFLGGIAVYTHHQTVLAEEKFLSERFKTDYRTYCSRVRRYL